MLDVANTVVVSSIGETWKTFSHSFMDVMVSLYDTMATCASSLSTTTS
jgi:hypothetical protein